MAMSTTTTTTTSRLTVVAKLRWTKKTPVQFLTIRNFEALRLMASAIMLEKAGKIAEAAAMEASAKARLEEELKEYLAGIQHVMPQHSNGVGLGELGGVL